MLTPELESKALDPSESRTSFIGRIADQTKVEYELKQTSLGNNRGTAMRPVVAKKTPKKQNTTKEKQPTRKRSTQIHRGLQISTDLETFSNSKKVPQISTDLKRGQRIYNHRKPITRHQPQPHHHQPPPPHHSTTNHH
ncbi:hypothetical protein QL285_016077 [Trifolium repens]|nr:hypothetical protein QL285_016077 [Trifolium repens]